MRSSELVERYPRCFHMALGEAWPSIRSHGLLSAAELARRFDATPGQARRIAALRPDVVALRGANGESALVRDQKPMNEAKLRSSLTDMTVEQWLDRLNSLVFFAATAKRLESLWSAYRDRTCTVMTVDTAALLASHGPDVLLSHLNTGAVRMPFHYRGSDTFQPVAAFEHRGKDWVAEIVVPNAVPDIESLVVDVEVRRPST
ncbi:MAG: hypothetical protein Q7T56_16050 [Nocardioidaceae bacterium]|nr:hypothetical protein [Nocardioidaceae bacterium]